MRQLLKSSVSLWGALAFLSGAFTSCNSIDCPLDNVVVCTYGLYDTKGGSFTLPTTISLTITLPNRDVTLLNQATSISSFSLPVSHGQDIDTLLFHFSNVDGLVATDTLLYQKTNTAHFENIACPASIFHSLRNIKWASQAEANKPLSIDSVAISRATINYEDVENIKIFLRSE